MKGLQVNPSHNLPWKYLEIWKFHAAQGQSHDTVHLVLYGCWYHMLVQGSMNLLRTYILSSRHSISATHAQNLAEHITIEPQTIKPFISTARAKNKIILALFDCNCRQCDVKCDGSPLTNRRGPLYASTRAILSVANCQLHPPFHQTLPELLPCLTPSHSLPSNYISIR